MADFLKPTVTSGYSVFVSEVRERDVDAITLCSSVPTNTPTGAIRYVRASDKFQEWNGSAWVDKVLAIAGGGTGAASDSAARTTLGLGTIATQNSNSVSITGGAISGASLSAADVSAGTLPLARGGTGASLSAGSEGQVLSMVSGAVAFSSLASAFPTGGIIPYGGATAPTGWTLCDGSAIDRTIYAALFSVIGTTYGVGNGTTTFNVPDLRQKLPLGKAASGTGNALGATGGAIDHTHTGPSHGHTTGSHSHTVSGHVHGSSAMITSGPSAVVAIAAPAGPGPDPATNAHQHQVTGNTDSATSTTDTVGDLGTSAAGTGATGVNNPPFLVVNYIVKH